jgi:uncharacterized membrane protein
MARTRNRRAEQGNTLLLGALMITLALGLFALITDVGLLYATKSRLQTYAQETARAGATAIDLNDYTASGVAHLNTTLAVQQANKHFQSLGLGPDYVMTILEATTEQITIQITHEQPVYLIGAFVPISSVSIKVQASAIPQVGF